MKNEPDFEHPEFLVAETMLRFPKGKLMTSGAIAKRFHERYGKRCSAWIVRRGIAALLGGTKRSVAGPVALSR